MATIEQAGGRVGSAPGVLDRERIIAKAGFNRWLVPPAALCIHLCIGMAYGFSVFWLPLSPAIGLDKWGVCPDMSLARGARGGGPAQGRRGGGGLLGRRARAGRRRRFHASALDPLARRRRDRRH